jgi:hypothetical protein
MKPFRAAAYLFIGLIVILAAGCTIRKSIYKRFERPKDLDEATEQRVVWGVVQAMRSQPFVDELKKRFPSVTQAQLLKTDIRWDVIKTIGATPSRSFFISVGVKDTTDFPDAPALVEFFHAYGKAEAEELVAKEYAKKRA